MQTFLSDLVQKLRLVKTGRQLPAIADPPGSTVRASSGGLTAVCDGDGNKVSETVGGVTTQYLVDTTNPTALPQVLDGLQNGSVTRTYPYGLQRSDSDNADCPVLVEASGHISEDQSIGGTRTPSFYGYALSASRMDLRGDGHGSVRFLTNMAGSVTDTYQYAEYASRMDLRDDAFGNEISSTGATPNNFLHSGEGLDSRLGLYYLRALLPRGDGPLLDARSDRRKALLRPKLEPVSLRAG